MKAIIDTCFIERFYKDTGISSDFGTLMKAANFELLIHPYIYEKEMSFVSHIKKAIEHTSCRIIEYTEFLITEAERMYYSGLFIDIYNDFYLRLSAINPLKAEDMNLLDTNTDIYNLHMSASSIGDVHVVLMALFMEVPIILSEDSDMKLIYDIAKTKFERGNYQLDMFRIIDVINYIKSNGIKTISGKELKRMRRAYD